MMKFCRRIFFLVLLIASTPMFSQSATASSVAIKNNQQQTRSNVANRNGQRDGQQVFEQYCSRCHNAPQSFSPHISGTISRHMRVRAGLGKEDEQAILRFLNP
jgi:cytochrome c5